MKFATSIPKSDSPAVAIFLSAKYAQPGDDAAPNRCLVMRYVHGSLSTVPFSHHKNLRWSWWQVSTRNCKNICSMLHTKATGSLRNRQITPQSKLMKFGLCSKSSFNDWDMYRALPSNTTRSFPSFLGW